MNLVAFSKRYLNYSKEVQEYMQYVGEALHEKYGDIPPTFMISLDLLASNLSIMLAALETLREEGVAEEDKYHGKKKSPHLQTYFTAQGYVNGILSNFGLNPMAKSRIRDNKDKQDVGKLLEALTA